MWGREMRAGLLFVLASVLAGGAFRSWRDANETRFADLVASLEETDLAARASRPGAAAPEPDASRPRDADAGVTASRGARTDATRGASRSRAEPLRPAALDVDRADAAALERLPGIGPALARRIVDDRSARGSFGGPEGLLRVPGIGPKTLARIRPYLTPPHPDAAPAR